MGSPSRMQRASNPLHPSPPSPQRKQGNAGSRVARHRRAGRSLVATAFSPSTTYDSPFLRRSKNPNAPRASADPGSVSERMASCHADRVGRAPRTPKRAVFTKNTTSCRFFLANAVCWCWAWHPAMPIYEGGLPEHRSEHQAPRRSTRTIIPDAIAEPPSERSVFGEPARLPDRITPIVRSRRPTRLTPPWRGRPRSQP
jgi:hypothetical protein